MFGDVQTAIAVYSSDELDLDDCGAADNNVELKGWLSEGKRKLDEAREALKYLCEPVPPPREIENYLHTFCGDAGNPEGLNDTEAMRIAFYKACANFVRAYSAIAQQLDEAGYAPSDVQSLNAEVAFFSDVRDAIKRHAGEELDIKPFESDMRHLINTYIQADSAAGLGSVDSYSLVDLIIKTGVHDAIAKKLNEKGKLSNNAVAEGIINNVRKTIIRDQLTDPRFYEQLSKLLEDLISEWRNETLSYKEFLEQAELLVKKLDQGQSSADAPAQLRGNRAALVMYNNLADILASNGEAWVVSEDAPDRKDRLLSLSLDIDHVMHNEAPAGWNGDSARESQVLNALFRVLGRNRSATAAVFELIKQQADYQ